MSPSSSRGETLTTQDTGLEPELVPGTEWKLGLPVR